LNLNRCAIAYLNVGSRTHGRDTFRYENLPWFSPFGPAFGCSNSFLTNLCAAKEKYPKERPPGCRLNPARRDFRRESIEGRSFALYRRASSMKRPLGLNPPKAPVLGAANGTQEPFSTINADIAFAMGEAKAWADENHLGTRCD
jgi:hypothetical protein